MKIRFKGNSIRIRIQQQELLALSKEGQIENRVTFGVTDSQQLGFCLRSDDEGSSLRADFNGNEVLVRIPTDLVEEMVSTEKVGVEYEKEIEAGKPLHILVEKDFKCLTPRVEDADAFPHPEEAQGHSC